MLCRILKMLNKSVILREILEKSAKRTIKVDAKSDEFKTRKSCRSRQELSYEYLLFSCKKWLRYSRERAVRSLLISPTNQPSLGHTYRSGNVVHNLVCDLRLSVDYICEDSRLPLFLPLRGLLVHFLCRAHVRRRHRIFAITEVFAEQAAYALVAVRERYVKRP